MQRLLIVCVVLAALSGLGAPVAVFAQDRQNGPNGALASLPPDSEVVVRFSETGPWRVQYKLELAAPDAAVVISLIGFDGDLDLFVRAREVIANPKDADHASTSRTDAEVVTLTRQSDGEPRPTVYYVMVENVSQRAATGRLLVRTVRPADVVGQGTHVTPEPEAPADMRTLTPGMRLDGSLTPDSRSFRDGRYSDRYRFVGTRGQLVEIVMRSFAFDTLLILRLPDGREYVDDDGVPEGSRLYMALPTDGEFEVICTSYEPREVGRYSLDFTLREAEVHELAAGERVDIHLGGGTRRQFRIDIQPDWHRLELEVTGASADLDIYARYSTPFNEIEIIDSQAEFWVNEEARNETLTLDKRSGDLHAGTLYVLVLNYDETDTDATFRAAASRPSAPVTLEPGVEQPLNGASDFTLRFTVPDTAVRCQLGLKHAEGDLEELTAGPEPVAMRAAPFGTFADFGVAAGTTVELHGYARGIDAAVVRFTTDEQPMLVEEQTITFAEAMFGWTSFHAIDSADGHQRVLVTVDGAPGATLLISRADGAVLPLRESGENEWDARVEAGEWVLDLWARAALDGRSATIKVNARPWTGIPLAPDEPVTVRLADSQQFEDFMVPVDAAREKLEIDVRCASGDGVVVMAAPGPGFVTSEVAAWWSSLHAERVTMLITRWTGRPLPTDQPVMIRLRLLTDNPSDVTITVRGGPLIDGVVAAGLPGTVTLPASRMAQFAVNLPASEAARIAVLGDAVVLVRAGQPFRAYSTDEMQTQFEGEWLVDGFSQPPFVPGGRIYLLVIGAEADEIEVVCEPAQGRQPTVLEPGSHDASLDAAEDASVFAIEGKAGQRLVVECNSGLFDPLIRLSAPGGEQWENDDANDDTTNSRLEITLPENGRYLLRVESYDERSGAFRLFLSLEDD